MELSQILRDFNRTKEKIRNKTRFKAPSMENYNGLDMAVGYSEMVEYVIKELFELTIEDIGEESKRGITAFLYGSPGRREMVCESDLDMMLIYKDKSKRYIEFKDKFREFAEPFEFCKVDIPKWGTLEEARIFAEKSITEGNQVLESRFICGDEEIKRNVKEIQEEFGGPERMIKNIVFQKFYFEQYFKQRVKNGAINVKYCDGGSRDYLFINWFNQLMERKYPDWDRAKKGRPVAEQGLFNIYNNGLISFFELGRAIDALNFNLFLRNEILLINKGTSDEGLTFLDEKTLNSVFERMPNLMKDYNIQSSKELAEQFDKQRFHIANIKRRIWDSMIDETGKEMKNKNWSSDFHKAYSESTPENKRKDFLNYNSPLMKIATIWGSSNSHQTKLFEKICGIEKDSDSWEIQASLTASPHCPPDYLNYIGTGIGKEMGYGYILRIVSRNPNVKQETLEAIATDSKIETRYTQCAKAAIEKGKDAANHQI